MTEHNVSLQRAKGTFTSFNDKFMINVNADFQRQYFYIYRSRLEYGRTALIEKAHKTYGESKPIRRISELVEREECVTIGTVCKIQDLRPNVLKEIADEGHVIPQPIAPLKCTSDTDEVVLEDENLRIKLIGSVDSIVVAVCGMVTSGGKFHVDDIIFLPVSAPTKPVADPGSTSQVDSRYVLLVSGLGFDAREGAGGMGQLRAHILLQWLLGQCGEQREQSKVSQICRLIIAGNSIQAKQRNSAHTFGQVAKYLSKKISNPGVEAALNFDAFLDKLVRFISVDVMPGDMDPANHLLPQQPLHKCLFPKSGKIDTLNRATNPYWASIDGVEFLGTSGQNVDDIYRFSSCEDRLTIMKNTLTWGHLCPTCPDTIGCYPYKDQDPFILDRLPHVYFAGNQPTFGVGQFHCDDGQHVVRVVSLPAFCDTGCAALVDLVTLAVEPIVFEVSLDSDLTAGVDRMNVFLERICFDVKNSNE
ncbi:DNA polymerase delta subunit 2 [Trichinella sp. T8]|nr:DNA polymerase delta subunit 2 [Trichinella sp. T8]